MILSTPLFPGRSNTMLLGLRSRCTMALECIYSTAFRMGTMYRSACFSENFLILMMRSKKLAAFVVGGGDEIRAFVEVNSEELQDVFVRQRLEDHHLAEKQLRVHPLFAVQLFERALLLVAELLLSQQHFARRALSELLLVFEQLLNALHSMLRRDALHRVMHKLAA